MGRERTFPHGEVTEALGIFQINFSEEEDEGNLSEGKN